MSEYDIDLEKFASVKVVGVGDDGNNAVNHMISSGLEGVEFIAVNTDAEALVASVASIKIQIGKELTKGLGAKGNHNIGEKAAQDSREDIAKALAGSDMVFIIAAMGGGTGTGAAPIVAECAKEMGALTIGIVTKDFTLEEHGRQLQTEQEISKMKEKVDALVTIPNERLLQSADKKTAMVDILKNVNDIICQGVQGISDLVAVPALISLDFDDIKTIMSNAGLAVMGIGTGTGENRAIMAAEAAIKSPLLEMPIDKAKGVILNFTGDMDTTLFEVNEAADIIAKAADPEAVIIFGFTINENLNDEFQITVIATGFDHKIP